MRLVANIPAFFILLFGIGAGHALLTASAASPMDKEMNRSQCQASCVSQFNSAAPEQKLVIEDRDTEPEPPEPYYLAFMGVGWSLFIFLTASLLRHLHWRPPDIIKLQVAYRF